MAAPAGAKMGWIFVIHAAQPSGHLQQCAEQGGAIVVQQFDQLGLDHQAAQLDQMAGALPARLGPVARVSPGADSFGAGDSLATPPQRPP